MYTINDKVITKTRVINSDINILWWKWTTHEGLRTFFGRDNRMEMRLGGPYEILFLLDNPPGSQGGEGNKVISYQPKKMLSFTWNAPPDHPEIRSHEHQTWVVLTFDVLAKDQVKASLYHLGWLDGEKWDAAYDYFNKAWEFVMDSLVKSCE